MSGNGIQTCPRCGRVLMGLEPCANCAASRYASETADSYGVRAESNAPRWLLLAGAILLLFLLCVVVSQRSPSPAVLSATETTTRSPSASTTRITPTQTLTPTATPDPEEAEFWRKKTQRELREAGEYVPTKEDLEYRDQVRTWQHYSAADDARAADYYMRRPETVGRR